MNDEIEFSLVASVTALMMFKITGTINFDTSEDLYEYIEKKFAERDDVRYVIFDVSEVSYVSSAGIGIFMSIFERMLAVEGKVALIGASATFQRVMKLTGCLDYFLLVNSLEEIKALIGATADA